MKENAVIVLHEIYGVNPFIGGVCRTLSEDYAVASPNLLGREPFSYDEQEAAYRYFQERVGFGVCDAVRELVRAYKRSYRRVFLLGFSVGATLAWCASDEPLCDGVVGVYGSRIRDFATVRPSCPTLLLFAARDSFDAARLTAQLWDRPCVSCQLFDAEHGFADPYGAHYDHAAALRAKREALGFFSALCGGDKS